MIGVVCCLAEVGSGVSFSYNDYNYDNSNSNVSSHIAQKELAAQTLPAWQKITNKI